VLGIASRAGETLRLEIRSSPDKALNPAFSETEWMDIGPANYKRSHRTSPFCDLLFFEAPDLGHQADE
jgi:hypothetical protein